MIVRLWVCAVTNDIGVLAFDSEWCVSDILKTKNCEASMTFKN